MSVSRKCNQSWCKYLLLLLLIYFQTLYNIQISDVDIVFKGPLFSGSCIYVNILGKTLDVKDWLSHLHVLCCFRSFLSPFIFIFLILGHHRPVKMTRRLLLYDSVQVSGHLFLVVLSSVGLMEFLNLCMYGNLVEKKYVLFKVY